MPSSTSPRKYSKRHRTRSLTPSSSCSASSASTSSEQERSKHYPMFEDAYLDTTPTYLRDTSRPPSQQPFLQRDATTHQYLLYGRYLLMKQLGKGTFAKVVLAKDLHSVRSASGAATLPTGPTFHSDVVALKIFRAERNYDDAFKDECDVLEHMVAPWTDAAGYGRSSADDDALLVLGVHTFAAPTARLTHRLHCAMVFPALGMSLLELLEVRAAFYESKRPTPHRSRAASSSSHQRRDATPPRKVRCGGGLPLFAVRSLAYQLLCFAHYARRKGVVHTDMKPENILIEHPKLLPGPDGAPMPLTLGIKVIDFGSAEFVRRFDATASTTTKDKVPVSYKTIQTRHYRAPEVIFRSGWTYPADAWSIGLIVLELLTGTCTFMTHDDEEHLAMMERLLGTPSAGAALHDGDGHSSYYSIFGRGDRFETFVSRRAKSGGDLRWPTRDTSQKSVKYLLEVPRLAHAVRAGLSREPCSTQRDCDRLVQLLEGLLQWDPLRRLTPAEALRHSFFAPSS